MSADEYADRLLALAEQLKPGEVLAVAGLDLAVARTSTGSLRVGFGWMSWSWPHGYAEALLRGELAHKLDRNEMGHFADRYRNDLDVFLAAPSALQARGIGRRTVWFDRASARRLASPRCERQAA